MDTKVETLPITTDELVGKLDALGVPFLTGGIQTPRALGLSRSQLLLGLARDPDARVRLSVIPLLLVRPEFAEEISGVAEQLDGDARLTFECYCTAAYWLQRKYEQPLADLVGETKPLSDWFSTKLGLTNGETDAARALETLGQRHRVLSREPINWKGTYEHAAQTLIKQLTWERAWRT